MRNIMQFFSPALSSPRAARPGYPHGYAELFFRDAALSSPRAALPGYPHGYAGLHTTWPAYRKAIAGRTAV